MKRRGFVVAPVRVAALIAFTLLAAPSLRAFAQDSCRRLFQISAEIDTSSAGKFRREDAIRARLAQRGQDFLRQNSNSNLIEVDVLAIGAGPTTAAFAVNYRGGKILILEATSFAGTFDRGRNAFFMNLAEHVKHPAQGRPVYHIPGSPIGIHSVLADPHLARVRVGKMVFPDAGAVGDLTLEALEAARTPVLFSTRARPIEFGRDGLIVKTDTGLTILAKKIIMGGHGEPRLTFPGDSNGSAAWIYATDKNALHRRVLLSDDLAINGSEALIRGESAVVTGDSFGSLIALDKLMSSPDVTKVFWIGKTVPAVAEYQPKLYKRVLDGIRAGKINLINGVVAKTFAVEDPTKIGVLYFDIESLSSRSPTAMQVVVSQQILAMGYHVENSVFEIASANPVGETIVGSLPKMRGVVSNVETEIARSANGVYFLGFRQGISDNAKHWFNLGLHSWLDYTFRAAALAEQLSLQPKARLSLSRTPKTRTVPIRIDEPKPRRELRELHFAELDLRREIGGALRGRTVNRKDVGSLHLRIENLGAAFTVTTSVRLSNGKGAVGGFVFPNEGAIFGQPILQSAILRLQGRSKNNILDILVPVSEGLPVLHEMEVVR